MVNLSNVIVITLVKTRMDAYDHDDDVVDDGDDDGIFV